MTVIPSGSFPSPAFRAPHPASPSSTPEGNAAPAPDLVITDVSFVPSTPAPGTSARMNVTVENQGNAPARAFDVVLSRDASGTQRVAGLAAGARQELRFGVPIPAFSQMLTVQVEADARGEVAESDEDNNWIVVFQPVGSPTPWPPQPPQPPLPPLPPPPFPNPPRLLAQ